MKKKTFNGIEIPDDLNLLTTLQKRELFQQLTESIQLLREEAYDCRQLNVWSYRKADDQREGVAIRFGNMLNGFPFDVNGHPFHNSECAYIAGAYGSSDDRSKQIQQQIATERNGHKCKMTYRKRTVYTQHLRPDFESYNVEWMKYVVWQKCRNADFARLLRQVPIDAHTVENTSLHKGAKAVFWGAKNAELMQKRQAVEAEVGKQNFRFKKNLKQAQLEAANQINEIGVFTGRNVMGKIIKLCSLALIFDEVPSIDLALLNAAELYLMGERLHFKA